MGAVKPEEEEGGAAETDSAWVALEVEEREGSEVILMSEGGGMHCSQ